jgi:hypothetical protein
MVYKVDEVRRLSPAAATEFGAKGLDLDDVDQADTESA